MSIPAPEEADQLQDLVEQLTDAAKACDYSPGAKGYMARTHIAGIAKDIVRLMMAPSDMSMHHSVNVLNPFYFWFPKSVAAALLTDMKYKNPRC